MAQKIGSSKNMNPTEKINETVLSKPLSISIGRQPPQQRKRYMGVRQSPSGRWVAEIKGTAQKIRLWLGTFDTAEAAAHAYDEAACLLRGATTRTNFWKRNKGGIFGGSGSSNSTGSSSVLSTKVLNQLLKHLETQRASKSSYSLSSVPSTSPLCLPPPPPPPPPPQLQQQYHKNKQELEVLIKRSAATHDEIMKGKVQRAVNMADMDLRLEDFSCFFAPFEIEGRERVEIGIYEYCSMLSAAAKGV